ncbi:hypothetical protein AALP_AA1G011800 [Arabis alpina]|uniref:Plant bHLH transcription factor ACT-like domain-containing protein n=1 Tax=Arabis alpina TaxID=50452 RepID=A0A087HKB3_ARAAL|nr:hypothetical protein AALP_AA1G011800 [Arabis alpina]
MHSADAKQTETTGLNQCVSIDHDDKENESLVFLNPWFTRLTSTCKNSKQELECRNTKIEPTIKENTISESIVETSETEQVMVRDETDVRVKVKESEVMIEVRCLYRDHIVADIVEAMSNLNMDAFTIRSCNEDGFLLLNLKASL